MSTPVPASMDQRSEMTSENVEHDISQLTASRAQCSKNLAASWTLDDNSLVGKLSIQDSSHCCTWGMQNQDYGTLDPGIILRQKIVKRATAFNRTTVESLLSVFQL